MRLRAGVRRSQKARRKRALRCPTARYRDAPLCGRREAPLGGDGMLLGGKVAVIYGGGAISEAVASAFTREGAKVFLAGRNPQRLAHVAEKVKAGGGAIETAQVDALDARAVDAH